MKKLLPYVLTVLAIFSCKDDDEITVQACSEATNVQATTIGINEVALSWNDSNPGASFTIEYGISGFIPGSGDFVNSDERSVVLGGLQANTSYDVYVQSICSTNNSSTQTAALNVTTLPPLVVPQFVNKLSDMNLYLGELKDLQASPYTIPYELATPLFTDYAHKQRLIALPPGEKMSFVDEGLPVFPDNTVITKTFFYNLDENDPSAGRKIIETRVLIKLNGEWELGNYHWNDDQSEAVLMTDSVTLPITYLDEEGETNSINYVIPGAGDCFTCHNLSNAETPIGPKLRTLNFNGQLQDFIDNNHISGILDASLIASLPSWDDDANFNREQRARAYFDVNCAHCHTEGGYCEDLSTLRLSYDTPFDLTNIYNQRNSIMMRMQENIPGFSMPWIGTTIVHTEGYELITSYLNSLD